MYATPLMQRSFGLQSGLTMPRLLGEVGLGFGAARTATFADPIEFAFGVSPMRTGFAQQAGRTIRMIRTRRIRSEGVPLGLAGPARPRRIRPTAAALLSRLQQDGATITFNRMEGNYYVGTERVHDRTVTALVASRMIVREPGSAMPTYRLGMKGQAMVTTLDKRTQANSNACSPEPLPPWSRFCGPFLPLG
jgi:hypothetical protein